MALRHTDAPAYVSENKALLVEGKDETNFFRALLKDMEIDGVRIFDTGGNRDLKNKIPAILKYPGFETNVTTYAVIRDAETDAKAAFDSVQYILNANRQPVPSTANSFSGGSLNVGIFVVPGDTEKGMLEDLCLATVDGHPALSCADGFMTCLQSIVRWRNEGSTRSDGQYTHPNNPSKARARAFLAANEHDLPSVGLAALTGVWDFRHSCLNDLKSFLTTLR